MDSNVPPTTSQELALQAFKEASLQQDSIGGMGVQQGTLRSSLRGVAFWSLGGSLIYNFNQDCCSVCNFKRSGRGDNVDALDGSGSWRAWTFTDCSIQSRFGNDDTHLPRHNSEK